MAGQPKTRQRTGRAPAPGASGTPASNYSWAPFQPGHTLSLRHGTFSRRVYGPLAAELAASQLERRPDLEAFPFELAAWAEAETRAAILRMYLDTVGMLDEDAKPRDSLLKWLLSFERLAAERRRSLGLDPRSAAELARERAEAVRSTVDLDGLRAQGRKALEAREAS